jgi:phage gp29-like protein
MATILDHRGNPLRTGKLTKEVATSSITSIRQVWHSSVASGLTPQDLALIIQSVDQGDAEQYLTLAEEMEENEFHYRSVLSTRRLAVGGLDVMVEAHSEDAQHAEHAEFVTNVVKDDSFSPLVDSLLDALGKGYSVAEIMWDRGEKWTPLEYKWRDPRHFQYDFKTQKELRMRDEQDMVDGLALEPYKFIVHQPQLKMGLQIRAGFARLAAVGYICKSFTVKDWLAFIEVYGMPLRLGKYTKGATDDEKNTLLNAVAQLGVDAGAIIPDSMMIEFVESGGGKGTNNDAIFQNFADWVDKQISKAVLGQVATTEGTPGKLGADDTQENVRTDILHSDAKQLSSTLNRDLVKPLIDLNFGPQERGTYPRLKLFTDTPEDLEMLSKSLPPFIDRGLPVEASVILDKFGLDEPAKGAVLLQVGTTPGAEENLDDDDEQGTGKKPKNDDADAEDVDAARVRNQVMAELFGKIRKGKSLTSDQRAAVVAFAGGSTSLAQDGADDEDEMDRLAVEALKDWRELQDPVLQPIFELARRVETFEAFSDGLVDVAEQMDSSNFVESLATAGFKARGHGDTKDDPND